MARISTYSIDPNLTPADKLHGSDENNVTRNFQIGPGGGPGGPTTINTTIINYITECDTRALAFLYHNNGFDGNSSPQGGSIVANNESSSAGSLQFSSITSFLVSKFPYAQHIAAATNNHCINIMTELVGEKIIWSSVYDPNKYGIYQCTGWTVDATYPNFYNMDLSFISGNGSLVASPDPLIYMVEVWGGGDKTFTHDQSSASNSWTVNHGLGKFPTVQIETSGGVNGYGQVVHNSNNQLTINFSANYTGKAHCN
tara:strand:- start:2066 stop:2833 length:768 start_codon:yes stop_codon:yes gene_type:complete